MFTPKFKAWDKKLGRWFDKADQAYIAESIFCICLCENENGVLSPANFSDRFELFWFAGLKDQNDVEIYEGEIMRVVGGLFEYTFKVVWDVKNARFMNKLLSGKNIYPFIDPKRALIIGHVRTNPELLEDKS